MTIPGTLGLIVANSWADFNDLANPLGRQARLARLQANWNSRFGSPVRAQYTFPAVQRNAFFRKLEVAPKRSPGNMALLSSSKSHTETYASVQTVPIGLQRALARGLQLLGASTS